ncbi:MAG TPA: mannosyltransferase family protein [Myxococcaceae bacterium]|jgi:hypothetical protein
MTEVIAPPTPEPVKETGPTWRRKFVKGVLLPYLLVRFVLGFALWVSKGLASGRGPDIKHPDFWLHGWSRWDSGWYLRIAMDGYATVTTLQQESSLAFFPAYPYLIRWIHALLPESLQGHDARVWIGMLISNLCILVALGLVHHCCERYFGRELDADRTVLYLLVSPAAFYFFALYTESFFLLFAVASFFFAFRQQWWLAGLMGLVLAMSRPTGILLAPALAWLYLSQKGWKWRELRWDVLALGLIPLGFALVGYNAYLKSGEPLAIFKIQAAWGRTFTSPFVTFQPRHYPHPLVDPISRVMLIAFLVLGVVSLKRLATPALGIFALLSMAPLWFTGTLTSVPRMLAVLFPIFALMSRYGRDSLVHHTIVILGMSAQVLLVVIWGLEQFVA